MVPPEAAYAMEVLLQLDWLDHDNVVHIINQYMQRVGGFDALSPGAQR